MLITSIAASKDATLPATLSPFGAEIHGLAVGALTRSAATKVRAIIAKARVAVFRNNHIDDAAFVDFLSSLGQMTFTDGETTVPGAPDLNIVSNVGRTAPPQSVFHTDTSYVVQPPAFTALRPVTIPEAGGATLFTDQVDAARRLPPRVRQWLNGRTVLHSATGLSGIVEQRRQPLLRRHPLTGETSLYLSTPKRCTDVDGVDHDISRRIVAALYRHSIKAARSYAHYWQPGDILVWDNRVTMHRADHDNVAGDRVFHRGMVLGEVPIGA